MIASLLAELAADPDPKQAIVSQERRHPDHVDEEFEDDDFVLGDSSK